MMSFNVGGRFLDLPADFDLQFTKKNPLFAFDDLECERTTSFRVPKTPNNMQIFGFSNDYHRYGLYMRKKIPAQMQDGIVVKDGYLYISKFSGNDFECIFVTGELLFLRDLREADTIGQFIDSDLICEMNSPVISAYDSTNYDAARVSYLTETYIKPSWLLSTIATQVVNNSGASVDFEQTLNKLNGYRIITGKSRGVPETNIKLTRYYSESPTEYEPYPIENDLTITGADVLSGIITTDSNVLVQVVTGSWDNPIIKQGYFKQWVTHQKVVIKFADTTPADIFLAEAVAGGIGFLGDYSFVKNSDGSVIYSGVPLAGREVELNVGQKFIILTTDDLHSLADAPQYISGFSISPYTIWCDVSIEGVEEQPNDATIRVRDNVPEISVVDLLKTIASLTGTLLSVRDGKVVFVEDALLGEKIWKTDAISTTNIKRTFGDYAQRNIIQYDSDENMSKSIRISLVYSIKNENITYEKELMVIPFNEGEPKLVSEGIKLYIRYEYDGYTIGVGQTGFDMDRAAIPANDSIKKILDTSTSIELKCAMSIIDFERLHAENVFYHDGAIWVWTQARWSRGIADLSLSKT